MDDGSDSRFWHKIRHFFGYRMDTPIEDIIREAKADGELDKDEFSMLTNILRLSTKTAREVMIPRPDVVFGDTDLSLGQLSDLIISSGHSRIPIYRANKDNVVGVIHAKDLLKSFFKCKDKERSITDLLRPCFFVPENQTLQNTLVAFKNNKIHLAITQDEYGGTSGIVTLEDVLEEIVGDIEDEYDSPKPDDIQHQKDGSYVISGRLTLDELDRELGLNLESEQVDTLSGYLCEISGSVPSEGDAFEVSGNIFKIKEADAKHISWVEANISPPSIDEEQTS